MEANSTLPSGGGGTGPAQAAVVSRVRDFLAAGEGERARDPEARLSAVLARCRSLLGLSRAGVWVAGPYGGPRCRISSPPDDAAGAAHLAARALDVAGTAAGGDIHLLDGADVAFLPLSSGGAFPGVLLLEREGGEWTDEDRLVALLSAERLAAVLERADRVRAERRLADRERILEDIGQVAGLGMWEWDVATNLISWSDQQCRIHGIQPSEAPTDFAGYLSFVHPDDQAQVIKEAEDVLRTGTPFWFRYRIVRRDGVERWVSGHGRVFRDEADNPLRMVGTVQDITERLAAEETLRQSEESYRAIFELAGDAMFVHDPETAAILDANRSACELHGVTLEHLKSFGVPAVSAPESPYSAEKVLEYVHRAAAGEPQRFEWLGMHSSGRKVWVEVSLTRATVLGEDRVIASVRNVSERKAAEEALHRAYAELEQRVEERTLALADANRALAREIEEQRLVEAELAKARDEAETARAAAERANRAKSEFLSRMSHELRTPMNSILGFAQVLEGAKLPDRQVKSVQHILRAGRHLLQLINEVLEIARIESGRHNFSLEPVRLSLVLQEALAMVRPLAAQGDVRIEEPAGFEDDPYVRADRQRLVQVLLNLLANAIKYNGRGGHVRVSAERVQDDQRGARFVLRVRDDGRGIPPDRVDQLFTPFSRLGAEQSHVEGTGLGLALSQRLAEAMGGRLRLESTGPGGSVFALDLGAARNPVTRGDDDASPPPSLDGTPHGPATLLYVEDNLANLSLVETILESRPKWRTLPALQGELGLELARQHTPDLILLDLHLPDIPGEDVLRLLRTDPRTMHIPVIVISADATRSSIERLLASGASAFLTKPIDIGQFLTAIERLLPAAATGR
jgi:PAS domain S-box-containing protein